MLDQITPVILTFNEERNIGRTLDRLDWANEIIIVDSYSTDSTVDIVRQYPRVNVFLRKFDTHANQWRFAINETGVSTRWILRLDADYQVPSDLVEELASLDSTAPVAAYMVNFRYAVFSRVLRSSSYPANTILFRRNKVRVYDKGHTEAWSVEGPVGQLKSGVVHDDWKPIDHWLMAQNRYMTRELPLTHERTGSLKAWVRRHPPLMPVAVFLHALLVNGLVLDGKAGVYYALQRLVAEAILSLKILEAELSNTTVRDDNNHRQCRPG